MPANCSMDSFGSKKKYEMTLFGMLDTLDAFDTIDHDILLERLRTLFGIHGTDLSRMRSFVRHKYANKLSETMSVTSGVPQGSVFDSIMFLFYTADVARIVEICVINLHSYADDSELYLHSKADEHDWTLHRVVSCIDAING